MSKRSFQAGTLVKVPNRHGFSWVLRHNSNGVRKATTIGNNLDLPTELDARIKAASMTAVINADVKAFTVNELIEKFIATEYSLRKQTVSSYASQFKHIKAQLGNSPLDKMMTDIPALEKWLSELQTLPTPNKPTRPLSKTSKFHIKALLHRLVECAMRYGYIPVGYNPIARVEIKTKGLQPKKRLKKPITVDQVRFLLSDPLTSRHVKVMIAVAVTLGLRISEILALKWTDIDFELATVSIERSIVGTNVDATKSDASEAMMPLSDQLSLVLQQWRDERESVGGWLFGSEVTGRPFHRDSLQADHLVPAGLRAGIAGLGWHTFRHSYIEFLRGASVADSTQMMMMRHADMRTTNSYGRDGSNLELKRIANQVVVDGLLLNGGTK